MLVSIPKFLDIRENPNLRRAICVYKVIEKLNLVVDLARMIFCLFPGENSDCVVGVSIDACLLYLLPHPSSYRVSPNSPASDTQSPDPVGKPPGPLRVKGRISWILLHGIKTPGPLRVKGEYLGFFYLE
jgi:hypothetical protein